MCNKLQQSFQVLYDPIADILDDGWNQNFSPLTNYEIQDQDDKGFISQTFQSVEISSQSLYENMQGNKDKIDILVSWHGGHAEQLYTCLNHWNNSVYILEDPFLQFLESTKEIKY